MTKHPPLRLFSLFIACVLLAGCPDKSDDATATTGDATTSDAGDTTQGGTLTSRDTSDPDTAQTGEDATDDAPDSQTLTPSDAALLAAQWVPPNLADAVPSSRVALLVTGLTVAELKGVEFAVAGVAATTQATFETKATAADLAYVERFASGARWVLPIQGDAKLELFDAQDNLLETLEGQANPDNSVTLRGKGEGDATLYDITIKPHRRPETDWTKDGEAPVDPRLSPSASFSLAFGVDAEGSAPAGIDAATRWVLTVNEETVCDARIGCDEPIFAPIRYSGTLSAERVAHFEAVVPADFAANDGEFVQVDVDVMPPGAQPKPFAVVLGINNTQKEPNAPLASLLRPAASDVSGVPLVGMESVEMFLLQGPWAGPSGTTDEIMQSSDRVVVVSKDWSTINTSPEESLDGSDAYVSFSGAPGSALQFWPNIPVHGFQIGADLQPEFTASPEGFLYLLTVDGPGDALSRSVEVRAGDTTPACYRDAAATVGYCALIYLDGRRWRVALTAWAEHRSQLPKTDTLSIKATTGAEGEALGPETSGSGSVAVSYDEDVAAVFAIDVGFRDAPLGWALGGEVSILEGDYKNLDQIAHALYDLRVVMGETHVVMAPRPKAAEFSAGVGVLIGGDPIPFSAQVDGQTVSTPPAVILHVSSNGKGTRVAATASNGKPSLL